MNQQPMQLPLFPDETVLTQFRPERKEWRVYRLAVWPDLFGRVGLARHWGGRGRPAKTRIDAHPDSGAAINALAELVRGKRRRGWRPAPAWSRASERRQARDRLRTTRDRPTLLRGRARDRHPRHLEPKSRAERW